MPIFAGVSLKYEQHCITQCQGPRAQIRLFWSSPVFGRKILRKSQSAGGPTQCKSGPGRNMLCIGVIIYCTFFNNNSPPPGQFLCNKILLKKLATVRRMLIEQIFELRRPGSTGRICTDITIGGQVNAKR